MKEKTYMRKKRMKSLAISAGMFLLICAGLLLVGYGPQKKIGYIAQKAEREVWKTKKEEAAWRPVSREEFSTAYRAAPRAGEYAYLEGYDSIEITKKHI